MSLFCIELSDHLLSAIISDYQLFQYQIPLQPALPVAKQRINQRQGLVLSLQIAPLAQAAGEQTCGPQQSLQVEIAPLSGMDNQGKPLQGFSLESLDDVSTWLSQHLPSAQTLADLHNLAQQAPYPSLAFALSLAVYQYLTTLQTHNNTPYPYVAPPAIPLIYFPQAPNSRRQHSELTQAQASPTVVELQALRQSVTEQLQTHAAFNARGENNADSANSQTHFVKIKVGQYPAPWELALIHAVLEVNPKLKLRLDANQAFSLEQAIEFCACLPLESIDYIEEPCATVADCIALYQALGIHYALDETLQQPNSQFSPAKILKTEALKAEGLKALVIKPMLYGTINELALLIHTAEQHGILSVLSSALEGHLGIHALKQLAMVLTPEQAPGIDTLKSFQQSLLLPEPNKPCLSLGDLHCIMQKKTAAEIS